MKKKQAFNPYLPSCEYVPDGEPHVFGDRIYLFGSHDRFGAAGFCLNDYVCWSAPVDDLSDWRYEGVIFRKDQDPVNQNIPADAPEQLLLFGIEPKKPEDLNPRGVHTLWAPDVVKGPDGRYYLYYCLDFLPQIGVAVCDSPCGNYEYLGRVQHADGIPLGCREGDLVQFDPGVFVDADGSIYLYSGNAPMHPEQDDGRHHSQVMRLSPDMLTLLEEPRPLLPGVTESAGTGFEGHEFFEASSIRKIGDLYYLVYSSVQSHELCYAVSTRPDSGYRFGGTLVDIGDVFLDGRTAQEAVNPLGNTHGGLECCAGQWYVFYHRQTDRTNFSRQGCAEKIEIRSDGSISQAEVSSCGLNGGPLAGSGTYAASICCHLTGPTGAVFSHPAVMKMDYPFLTQEGNDLEPSDERMARDAELPVQYVSNLRDGATVGFKYFDFHDLLEIILELRGNGSGSFEVRTELSGTVSGSIEFTEAGNTWQMHSGRVSVPDGVHALYLTYRGQGSVDLRRIILSAN